MQTEKNDSLTAAVRLFARAYHNREHAVTVLEDKAAIKLLTEEEYNHIGEATAKGVSFFAPHFQGTQEQAIRFVACTYLCPATLSRTAFAENALACAESLGTQQYVLLGAESDTFAYRQPYFAKRMRIFETDRPTVLADKIGRLARAKIVPPENVSYIAADFTKSGWEAAFLHNPDFDREKTTFVSLLGTVSHLPTADFVRLLQTLRELLCTGSTLVFDCSDETADMPNAGFRAQKWTRLCRRAGKPVCGGYSEQTLMRLLSDCGFRVYEYITPSEITAQYFSFYNRANPEYPMTAFDNLNFCLAVRK